MAQRSWEKFSGDSGQSRRAKRSRGKSVLPAALDGSATTTGKAPRMITQTVVFQFATQEQRAAVLEGFAEMMTADEAPRIVGLSLDDEMRRSQLMFEALERCDDHYDLRDAIESISEAPSLAEWSWEKFDAED